MSIQQLQSDVNVVEDQELRRLEGGNVIRSAGGAAVATTDVASPLLLGGASVQVTQLVETNAAQPKITARVLPVAHASYAVPVAGMITVSVGGEVPSFSVATVDVSAAQVTGVCVLPAAPAEGLRSAGGPIRSVKKQRRAELLQTRWRCGYCTKYTERSKNVCGSCNAPRGNVEGGDRGAELLRYESRKSHSKGRQYNRTGCTCYVESVCVCDARGGRSGIEPDSRIGHGVVCISRNYYYYYYSKKRHRTPV